MSFRADKIMKEYGYNEQALERDFKDSHVVSIIYDTNIKKYRAYHGVINKFDIDHREEPLIEVFLDRKFNGMNYLPVGSNNSDKLFIQGDREDRDFMRAIKYSIRARNRQRAIYEQEQKRELEKLEQAVEHAKDILSVVRDADMEFLVDNSFLGKIFSRAITEEN